MNSFDELALITPLRQAISAAGYTTPTPIQAQAIPPLLQGRDLLGCAQTGTGKTAAFALPVLHRLNATTRSNEQKHIRALVLTPTRELGAQILASFQTYGTHTSLKALAIYGGVGRRPQVRSIRRGVDILIATPGRLLDLMSTKEVDLKRLDIFVLDEADRMLDMGFIHDVKRIISALPAKRQSLFFSATMPKAVAALADSLLTQPVKVEVSPQATPAERIQQSVLFVEQSRKDELLHTILSEPEFKRVLVFTRTKHRADKVVRKLMRQDISADAIHGNKSQNARDKALQSFRNGKTRVLVATDIAARGIDINDISHVINYELPNEPESYVHRIGRTARAGNDGSAISFCSIDERNYLCDIERTMRCSIEVVRDHPCHSPEAENILQKRQNGSKGSLRQKSQPSQKNTHGQSDPNVKNRNRNRKRKMHTRFKPAGRESMRQENI